MSKCTFCIHNEACQAWIEHGKTLYDDFEYSVDDCPHFKYEVSGQWIYKPFEGDPSLWLYHCSECDTPSANKRNYCQYCGVKMDLER